MTDDEVTRLYGKAVAKLAAQFTGARRDAYVREREAAYLRIRDAYVAAGCEPPPRTILSGG